MQKILGNKNYPEKDRTESKGYLGVQGFIWITENNLTKEIQGYELLEYILSPSNLNEAYLRVKRNKGVGGVDKMEVKELQGYLMCHKEKLVESILQGKYQPNPVRRVEIPKEKGEQRLLGIPTVVDRVVQQAISQILTRIYEPKFSESSYGFRPKRNAHQALKRCQEIIASGYGNAVDLDLSKFFDRVNHSKLVEVLSRTIKDGRVISLIHKYLNAGVQTITNYEPTKQGVPQGGPLSPLLSNIMLNELDKELESRGHKFVRYADDIVIFCKSKRGSERIMQSITKFIEEKLFLEVNVDKSQVCRISKVKFLGYSFYKKNGEGRLRIHRKSVSKMKEKLKQLTSRSNGWGNERRKLALRQYIIGWVNYFKLADMQDQLKQTDGWYRRRLRMVIWKQWKRISTKFKNLQKLGIDKYTAWKWSNTRKGYWHIAKSYILSRTITNERLKLAGYVFLSDIYNKVKL